MARAGSVRGVLGRPPFVAAIGVTAMLLVVWSAGAPPTGWGRSSSGVDVVAHAAGSENLLFRRGCDYCLRPAIGPGARTSDLVAAVLGWAVVAVLALVAAGGLALALRMLVTHLTDREDRGVPADDAVALDLEALSLTLATGTRHRLDALSAGTPAEGIIAAWSHLEATVHDVGMPLPLSRTSTEVSLEVLRRFSVDRATLDSLGGLYREARWSRHPLTEGDRGRAASAYRRLEAVLRQQMRGAGR